MYYILLDICEKYGMSPNEMDETPDDVKYMMIAKYRIDAERRDKMNKD